MENFNLNIKLIRGVLKHFNVNPGHIEYDDFEQELALVCYNKTQQFYRSKYELNKLDSYLFCQFRRYMISYFKKQARRQEIAVFNTMENVADPFYLEESFRNVELVEVWHIFTAKDKKFLLFNNAKWL